MINPREKIKVLFMIDNLHGGGAENVLSFILRDLNREKFEVSLFLVIKEGIYLSQVPNDVKIIHIFSDVNRFMFSPCRYLYRLYRRLSLELFKLIPWYLSHRSKIRDHYDIGISFCEGHNLPLLSLKSNLFGKTISWIHVDLRIHHCPLGINRVGRYASLADRIFFVSQDAMSGFLETFPEHREKARMEVVYNPIDAQSIIRKAEMAPVIEKNKPTLIAIGRLCKQKRFEKLINIHKKILDKGIGHQVWILGEGEDRMELEKQVQTLGVGKSCLLQGFQDPIPYLKASDIFVMTSDYEGLPVVICEAMILGKPIVSTCVTGPRELLEEGKYGILTENNEEALEKGIIEMLLHLELRETYSKNLIKDRGNFIFPTNLSGIERRLEAL